jgi:hypothetical protein
MKGPYNVIIAHMGKQVENLKYSVVIVMQGSMGQVVVLRIVLIVKQAVMQT